MRSDRHPIDRLGEMAIMFIVVCLLVGGVVGCVFTIGLLAHRTLEMLLGS